MPDPIMLPHPIRSEQERENIMAAVEATYEWHTSELVFRLPPVEPLPELLDEVWAIVGNGLIEVGPVSDRSRLRKPLTGESLVRLAVAEVLDPEPEPPKAAPSGWVYEVCHTRHAVEVLSYGTPGGHVVARMLPDSVPPIDREHVAALLREAEHGTS